MFDFNAKLGHWPYRPVKGLDDLLRQMDAHGIARAAVSSLNSVHYLNPQDGNEELIRQIEWHRDRLVPFAVLRPNFTGWKDDLAKCVEEFGMKAIVLHPNYHRYDLSHPQLEVMAERAAAWSLPICIQAGMEDPRRQFDREILLEVPAEQIAAFAVNHTANTVVALGLKFGQPERAGKPFPKNFYFDISNYETMGEMETAVDRFGADRMVLGTNFPLFNIRANVDKLRLAEIDDSARQLIAHQTAERLLGL